MTTLTLEHWDRLERTQTSSGTRPRAWWALVLGCIGVALLGRLCYLLRAFDADAAMFIYMGKLTSEGGRLCHDLIDNKFPTVGLITSIPWRTFGANWAGYVILGTVLSLFSVIVLTRIAKRHLAENAVLPVGLFAIVFLNFCPAVFGGFQLETMQVLFAVLGALAAMQALIGDDSWDAFVVGLCAGCAAMLKPTGLALAGAFLIALPFSRPARGARRFAILFLMLLIGFTIPICAGLLYLIQADILRNMPALARQISTYAANSTWGLVELFKLPTVAVVVGFPFLIRLWVFRRPKYRAVVTIDRSIRCFVIAWLVLELFGVIIQRRMYAYHFLVILPPAALLFGMMPRRDALAPLAAGLLPIMALSMFSAVFVVHYRDRHRPLSPVSAYLLEHARPGDAVWQDEMMRVLIETNLRPASRIPMGFLFTNYDEAPLHYSSMILDDFARTHPEYIILRTDLGERVAYLTRRIAELEQSPTRRENFVIAWRRIKRYVDEHYRAEAIVGRETVYGRIE